MADQHQVARAAAQRDASRRAAERVAQLRDRDGSPMLTDVTPESAATEPGWRCFHCDEVFTDASQAALHFGTSQLCEPRCQVDSQQFRTMEQDLARYREEDTELHRLIARLRAEHTTALQREEEKGYARGLADAAAFPGEMARSVRDARPVRVAEWTVATFSTKNMELIERARRFLEEALELAQASGLPSDQAERLQARVYRNPADDPVKELGGVGITLLGLAEALNASADDCEAREMERIMSLPVEHWRQRHAAKAVDGILGEDAA